MSWIWTGDLSDQDFLRDQQPEKRPEGRSTRRITSSLRPPIELFDEEHAGPLQMVLVWGGGLLVSVAFWIAVIWLIGAAI